MTIWRLVTFLFLLLTPGCGDDCSTLYRSNENGLLVFVGCDGVTVPATPTQAGG